MRYMTVFLLNTFVGQFQRELPLVYFHIKLANCFHVPRFLSKFKFHDLYFWSSVTQFVKNLIAMYLLDTSDQMIGSIDIICRITTLVSTPNLSIHFLNIK